MPDDRHHSYSVNMTDHESSGGMPTIYVMISFVHSGLEACLTCRCTIVSSSEYLVAIHSFPLPHRNNVTAVHMGEIRSNRRLSTSKIPVRPRNRSTGCGVHSEILQNQEDNPHEFTRSRIRRRPWSAEFLGTFPMPYLHLHEVFPMNQSVKNPQTRIHSVGS